ncbi:MAG: filamentous hemagglutinin N-terminal domain-containing protein, partial [Chlamydiae bacterium]|nr:filamentous hemagglutinin N-terminal domain-containing protein [Chlamydiota bacterium]
MKFLRVGITLFLSARLFGNPTGAEVVAGDAVFSTDAQTLSISTSDKAIINYKQFNIDKGEKVRFIQPSSRSCVLNRVIGGKESKILGRLEGNGRVFLVNPQGIYFGPDSIVNAGSFLATSLSIKDEDFLSDSYQFCLEEGATGSIINEGTILTEGFAALFAPSVKNLGNVYARVGKVFIGSAEKVALDISGDGLIQFRVEGDLEKALIENYGKIEAALGEVQISALSARRAIQSVLNTDGLEVAAAIEEYNGCIRLLSSSEVIAKKIHVEADEVLASGRMDVSNHQLDIAGGVVEILGDKLELRGALIDASSEKGSGSVFVGGEYQGSGRLRNAKFTLVDGFSEIKADAYTLGDGGKVIIWSDETTIFNGRVYARGGKEGGNGGFVETSGKENLGIDTGHVDTSAVLGDVGEWLLDPRSITVVLSGGTGIIGDVTSPNCTTITDITINASVIAGAAASVTLCATGDATSSITINSPINMTTPLAGLTLTAGSSSTGTITLGSDVTTIGGNINFNGFVVLSATTITCSTVSGDSSGADITFSNLVDGAAIGANALTINAGTAGAVTFNGHVGNTKSLAALTVQNASTITIPTGNGGNTGGIKAVGPIYLTAASILVRSGALMTNGAAVTFNGPVTLYGWGGSTSLADTTNNGAFPLGGNITFTGLVQASLANQSIIGMKAGSTGVVTFAGPVGGPTITTALGGLAITSALSIVQSSTVQTTGGISYGSSTTAPNNPSATIAGNITTSGGVVNTYGLCTLTNTALTTIDTTFAGASSAGAAITFSSTINGTTSNINSLTLNSGTGGISSILGSVGNVTPLGALTVSSLAGAGSVTLGSSS